MSEHKPDSKLVMTPVPYLCGNPDDRKPTLAADEEVYGMKGPEGLSANDGIEQVLVYKDIMSEGKADEPSDMATFKGEGSKTHHE
jgi:hypothetical protein